MMRITTSMVMRNYQNNLTSTLGGLESARRQVETGRRFSQSYEDPSAAASAAILERRYLRNQDYIENAKNAQSWQDTQEDVVTQLSNMAKEVAENYSVKAVTGTAGEGGRDAYARQLRGIQQSMVQALNTKYGETFAMAGSGGDEAPFTLSEDGMTLLYRGANVDAADTTVMDKLSKETSFIDLGFGLSFDNTGNVVPSSAFNSAFPGINAIGYGKTDDGTSKNVILLAGQMAKILEADGELDTAAYGKLWDQYREGSAEMRNCLATLGTKTQLLTTTKDKLESERLTIIEQYDDKVNLDPAEAITNYSWAMYAYNTALKVGTSIITPSLLDFLK